MLFFERKSSGFSGWLEVSLEPGVVDTREGAEVDFGAELAVGGDDAFVAQYLLSFGSWRLPWCGETRLRKSLTDCQALRTAFVFTMA